MPENSFYSDLTLAEALRKLAKHHIRRPTRHISRAEYDLVVEAAGRLENNSSDRGPDTEQLSL